MVGTARYVFVVFDLTNEYSPSLLKKVRTSLVEAAMSPSNYESMLFAQVYKLDRFAAHGRELQLGYQFGLLKSDSGGYTYFGTE